jgi:hypothetical protein
LEWRQWGRQGRRFFLLFLFLLLLIKRRHLFESELVGLFETHHSLSDMLHPPIAWKSQFDG